MAFKINFNKKDVSSIKRKAIKTKESRQKLIKVAMELRKEYAGAPDLAKVKYVNNMSDISRSMQYEYVNFEEELKNFIIKTAHIKQMNSAMAIQAALSNILFVQGGEIILLENVINVLTEVENNNYYLQGSLEHHINF